MASEKNLLDDVARVAGGAASLLSTVRRQIKSDIQERARSYASTMDSEENFEMDRLIATVNKLRLEQESLKQRVSELESALCNKNSTKSAPAKAVVKKAATTKTAPKKAVKPVAKKTVKRK